LPVGSNVNLADAIAMLSKLYATDGGAQPRTAFRIILWKNIGYLIDDDRRAKLLAEFTARVGTNPAAIAAAPRATLMDIAMRAGMRPQDRVEKWREIASLALERADGDLDATLRKLPAAKAVALLKAFPGIAQPGADEIMLFAGLDVRPAIDSNGLRAMLRLGFCKEASSYGGSYKTAVEKLRSQATAKRDWFERAFHVLRQHGQSLCKRSAPNCTACPLESGCPRLHLKGSY
jgi:endonuclease III